MCLAFTKTMHRAYDAARLASLLILALTTAATTRADPLQPSSPSATVPRPSPKPSPTPTPRPTPTPVPTPVAGHYDIRCDFTDCSARIALQPSKPTVEAQEQSVEPRDGDESSVDHLAPEPTMAVIMVGTLKASCGNQVLFQGKADASPSRKSLRVQGLSSNPHEPAPAVTIDPFRTGTHFGRIDLAGGSGDGKCLVTQRSTRNEEPVEDPEY
jgi:hypothetical protein